MTEPLNRVETLVVTTTDRLPEWVLTAFTNGPVNNVSITAMRSGNALLALDKIAELLLVKHVDHLSEQLIEELEDIFVDHGI